MTDVPQDVVTDLFGFSAPSENQLKNIARHASRALELKAHIEQVEEQLNQLNKELSIIETVDLAKAMVEAGVEDFTLSGGASIKLRDVIRNGLSKDPTQRQATFDWVTDNGGKNIIKDHFEVDYDKGSYEQALKLRAILQEHHINFDEFESIHVQTLWAFLREKLNEGKVMPPFEDMGLYYAKHAVVTPDKTKK